MITQSQQPRVRTIEAAHIADLIRIADETNLSPWSAQNYLDEMKNAEAIMFRLEGDNNTTKGFIVGRTVLGTGVGRLDAEIYNIAVVPEAQDFGNGQRLFDAFFAECEARNVSNIWLEVRASNEKALAFYRRNGFALVQTRNHFYANPREHALLLRKKIY